MARPGFLERLTGDPARDELGRVLRNLEAVLNTQAGYGSFVRGFGLGEYMYLRCSNALVEALTSEIQYEIAQHEPRLSDVEVELKPQDGGKAWYAPRPANVEADQRAFDSGLWLHFAVTAVMNGAPLELSLYFDTVSSRVHVKKKD
jgi:type VI secretion system protein